MKEQSLDLPTEWVHEKPFDWIDYGGPLAILKLCQFVRFNILKDKAKKPSDRVMTSPKNEYIQQGNLIFKKVKEIPEGAKKINIKGKSLDLGNGHKLIFK